MFMSLSDTPSSFTLTPALQYGEANGTTLYLDMLRPSSASDSPLPAVMYIHGGGWFTGARSTAMYPWLNPLLVAHGFITVSITYRLSQEATFPAQIHDVKAAVRWLRANAQRYGIDAERIGVWGDSAGGHLAALLGLTADLPTLEGDSGAAGYSSRVQAVVARVAPSDFLHSGGELTNDAPSLVTQLFGGTIHEREELMRLGSPITHVKAGAPPFLIVHGTLDETVPFEQGKRLYEALKGAGNDATLIAVPDAYHNLRTNPYLPWSDEKWDEMGWQALAFFQKHLCS
jgi:acetyl esterase/lipase